MENSKECISIFLQYTTTVALQTRFPQYLQRPRTNLAKNLSDCKLGPDKQKTCRIRAIKPPLLIKPPHEYFI